MTVNGVEKRVSALTDGGQLIKGATDRTDGAFTHVTTPEHVAQERQLLSGIDQGPRGLGADRRRQPTLLIG